LLDQVPHEVLSLDLCLPAVGQGALAIEGSLSNEGLQEQLRVIENSTARIEITAERAMLQKLEGNCYSAIAGHATIADARIKLEGLVASYDGDQLLTATSDTYMEPGAPDAIERAQALGEEVAARLLERGARDLIRQAELAAMQSQLTTN
jgi:hydroxymethylbilane synthase